MTKFIERNKASFVHNDSSWDFPTRVRLVRLVRKKVSRGIVKHPAVSIAAEYTWIPQIPMILTVGRFVFL